MEAIIIGIILGTMLLLFRLCRVKKEFNFYFRNRYLESKAFYFYLFNDTPSITLVNDIDITEALKYLQQNFHAQIKHIYTYNDYEHERNELKADMILIVMKGAILIELSMAYAEFLYPQNKSEQIERLVKSISIFKEKKKHRENEMNIIVNGEDGLILKTLDIKSNQLNIEYFYNDDFLQVHRDILARLKTPNDKGIVLLHGLPGTGKTTYLRYLIGEVDKRILFVSPSVAENLMDPTFIDLLIDNPNAILIIEDAENIIMDRKVNAVSSVSNLLNLSDGLLSDCLNVQIICTFNSNISTIDNALMRKGRLIARYEFGKLKIDKAQQLCDFLEREITVKREMTLAELMNANNTDYAGQNIRPIGFRREHALTEN